MADTLASLQSVLDGYTKQASDLATKIQAWKTDADINSFRAKLQQVGTQNQRVCDNKDPITGYCRKWTYYHPWVDKDGNTWANSQSDSEYNSALQQVNSTDANIAQSQSVLDDLTKNKIPAANTAIQTFDANDPATVAAAKAVVSQAQAQGQAVQIKASTTATNTKTLVIGGIAIAIVLAVVFIMHERKVKAI